ncbi:MAG TPA: ATP-binding cassette domain-containing protein, partial [Caldithrix abyssi]|nr:ATP-binding cassette domain-containing protein [Caldithrix abyssi]
MLKLENVNMSYGDVQVLWDVTFEVREGEILVLVGANGAGKSSTLKTISGLQRVSSGTMTFNGQDITRIPAEDIIKLGIVHVPEGRRLFGEMTVEENLIMGSLHGEAKKERQKTIEECYELFPRLKERRKQLAGTLSGGEQQMLAVARGL